MAIRTDDDSVKGVLQDDYGARADGSLPSLTRYIAIANKIVDKVSTCAIAKGQTIDSDVLTEIETWLAAHYYTRSDKALISKSTMGSSASYQGQTAMGLQASFYGQSALDLDFSGCLRSITMGNVASADWLGKPASEQIPLDQRD